MYDEARTITLTCAATVNLSLEREGTFYVELHREWVICVDLYRWATSVQICTDRPFLHRAVQHCAASYNVYEVLWALSAEREKNQVLLMHVSFDHLHTSEFRPI
jgi:hypothetical protein